MVAGLLLLLPSLRHLTTHPTRAAVPVSEAAVNPAGTPVHLDLQSTKLPFHFEISSLGTVIWSGDASDPGTGKDVVLAFPKEGVDLLVEASWNDDKPAVLKISLTRGDESAATRMLWGNRSISDVLTFR